jgi:DNA polymerase III delta prime subunit
VRSATKIWWVEKLTEFSIALCHCLITIIMMMRPLDNSVFYMYLCIVCVFVIQILVTRLLFHPIYRIVIKIISIIKFYKDYLANCDFTSQAGEVNLKFANKMKFLRNKKSKETPNKKEVPKFDKSKNKNKGTLKSNNLNKKKDFTSQADDVYNGDSSSFFESDSEYSDIVFLDEELQQFWEDYTDILEIQEGSGKFGLIKRFIRKNYRRIKSCFNSSKKKTIELVDDSRFNIICNKIYTYIIKNPGKCIYNLMKFKMTISSYLGCISRCTTFAEILEPTYLLLLPYVPYNRVKDFFLYLKTVFVTQEIKPEDLISPQALNFSNMDEFKNVFLKSQEAFDFYKSINNSEIIRKLSQCLIYLLKLKIIESKGLNKFADVILGVKINNCKIKETTGDIIIFFIETFYDVMNKIIHAIEKKDFKLLFKFNDETHELFLRYNDVMVNVRDYKIDTLSKYGKNEHQLLAELDNLIIGFTNISKNVSGMEKNVILSKLLELKKAQHELISEIDKASVRIRPFALLFKGPSGVGKSTSLENLIRPIMLANKFEYSKDSIINLNANDAFQSEFKSKHSVVILDDIANTNKNFTSESPLQMVIDMVNNLPKAVLSPIAELKGKIQMRPLLVMGTTNVDSLDSGSYSNCPSSILSRFNYHIDVRVKPEYQETDSGRLRQQKYDTIDLWHFTVKKARQANSDIRSFEFIDVYDKDGNKLENINLATLISFCVEQSKSHYLNQTEIVKRMNSTEEMELCEHFNYPQICPDCHFEPQAGESIDYLIPNNLGFMFQLFLNIDKLFITFNGKVLLEQYENILNQWSFVRRFKYYILFTTFTCYLLFTPFFLPYIIFCVFFFSYFELLIMYCHYLRIKKTLLLPYNTLKMRIQSIRHCARKSKTLLICMAIAYILYKFRYRISAFVKFWCVPQGCEVKPMVVDTEQKINMWRTPVVDPIVGMCRTIVGDDLEHLLVNNVAYAEFFSEDNMNKTFCNVLPLGNGCYLVPYHILARNYYRIHVKYFDAIKNIGPNFTTTFGRNSWERIKHSDICILFLNQGGSRRNLIKFFPTNKTSFEIMAKKGRLVYRDLNGNVSTYNSKCISTMFTPKNAVAQDYDDVQVYQTTLQGINTFVGLCGAPVLINSTSTFIGGIHIAGINGQPTGIIQKITQGEINDVISLIKQRSVVNLLSFLEDINLQSDNLSISNTPNKHSSLNFLDEEVETLNYYGTHNRQLRDFRSEVVDSEIAPFVFKHFNFEKTHGPPQNMNNYKPWRTQLLSLTNLKNLDVDFLNFAYMDFQTKIFNCLNLQHNLCWKQKLHPLDNDTIIAGNDGVYGIDSITLSTSTGWPTCVPKSTYIKPSDRIVENISVPLDVEPWIWEEVESCEKKLLKRERILLVHRCNLKDEPTKLTKDKVRVFAGTPLVGLILVRKYFLPMCKLMMENSELFECAVGVNAHGPSWDKLTRAMIKYGDKRVIAGDYKHYDATMSSQISSLALRLYLDIARWAGYNDDQITIMEGLATELTNPLYEFNGDFIMVNGSNPSGHSLTVFVNNIVNSLYLRYVFYKIYRDKENLPLFHEVVSVICYGDDNKMSVKEGFDEFNHTSISETLALDNITYTMADKEAKSVPFITNEECNFLKRSSIMNKELGLYLAPLEESTLKKMLHSHLRSKTLSMEESSIESIKNVSYESFFHGRDFYEDYRRKLLKVIEDAKYEWFFNEGLPDYDQRLLEWKDKYLSNQNN